MKLWKTKAQCAYCGRTAYTGYKSLNTKFCGEECHTNFIMTVFYKPIAEKYKDVLERLKD